MGFPITPSVWSRSTTQSAGEFHDPCLLYDKGYDIIMIYLTCQ